MAAKRPTSPLAFLITTSILLFIVVAVQRPLPGRDLFALIPIDGHARFGPMTAAEMYAAKFAHARANPGYAVGVFGNSRSLMLGANHLGLKKGTFFNFSVPGQSMRTSVVLLEKLAAAGKAPRTALVSFDHAELEFYQNPDLRGVLLRSRLAWQDVALVFDKNPPPTNQWLRIGWRQIYAAYNGLSKYLDAEQLKLGIRWWRRGLIYGDPWKREMRLGSSAGYRRDGSIAAPPAKGPQTVRFLPRAAPSVLTHYLAHDLRRLARLRRSGINVIVYESPIEPKNARHFAAQPSIHAVSVRTVLKAVCRETGLECHLFRHTALPPAISPWQNADHAPASVLGTYLRPLISPGNVTREK